MDYVRFPFLWPKKEVDASHKDIIHDANRCILCQRCVRASDEVDKKGIFAVKGRGIDSDVTAKIDSRLADTDVTKDDVAVQICPTGSLCEKELAYKTRYGDRPFDETPIEGPMEPNK